MLKCDIWDNKFGQQKGKAKTSLRAAEFKKNFSEEEEEEEEGSKE